MTASTRSRRTEASGSMPRDTSVASDHDAADEDSSGDDADVDGGAGDKEYEIEAILDHRYDGEGGVEYLVAWVGYAPRWNLWVPRVNCDGCEEMLSKYDKEWGVNLAPDNVKRKTGKAPKKTGKKRTKAAPKPSRRASSVQASTSKPTTRTPPTPSSMAVEPVRTSTRLHDKRKSLRPLAEMTNEDLGEIVDEDVRLKLKRQIGRERFGNMASWESVVVRVNGVHMEGSVTAVELDFEGGFHFAFALDVVRERCPQRFIEYLMSERGGGGPVHLLARAATSAPSPVGVTDDALAKDDEVGQGGNDQGCNDSTLTDLMDDDDDLEYVS